MSEELIEQPEELQQPTDMQQPEAGSVSQKFRKRGTYEYKLLPNGRIDNSQVKILYKNGDVYEGKVKKNKYDGSGQYVWNNGATYKGLFENGKLGQGIYTAANGDVYEGKFQNNKFAGEGKYTWADGSLFEGTFSKGKILKGKFTDAEGNVYDCQYNYKLGKCVGNVLKLQHKAEAGEKTPVVDSGSKPIQEEHKKKTAAKKKDSDKKSDVLKTGDRKVIFTIKNSKAGSNFKNLYSSKFDNQKDIQDLVHLLAYFTDSNVEQIKRIVQSAPNFDASKHGEKFNNLISSENKRYSEYRGKNQGAGKQKTATAGSGSDSNSKASAGAAR